ncbi:MAG: helix-turn-helix transcriptional regulator [Thermodesulfobacteriota bacterium]|nr:helix-turn-helix transcriptional regulator [Thermodesulfobacteriota bacterium]
MKERALLNTKEISHFLDINEKMVYSLIADKGLPATKVTGKWLFPKHLVERWLENQTINYPHGAHRLPPYEGLLIISGSNDILLDRSISLFNQLYGDHIAVFGNLGSQGGLKALSRGLCHIASSHLLQENEEDYNFEFAFQEFKGDLPALVNFCRREQGLLVSKGNPKGIKGIPDLDQPGTKIANRPVGTGTRLLLDRGLQKAGMKGRQVTGYEREFRSHMDVGLEVLSGRADAAPAIRPVAHLLGLDFVPLRWERYDLLISKDHFFEEGVQLFVGLLHEQAFGELSQQIEGYDLSLAGKMVFPQQSPPNKGR